MINPAVDITLSRTSLPGSLSPLELSGAAGSDLEIVGYIPPDLQRRITYAPDSRSVDGSEALAVAWQQAMMTIDYRARNVTTETAVQAARALVVAAIGQFAFIVTTTVSGAASETWAADSGSIVLRDGQRTFSDLANLNPVYRVTIPVKPISGS